MTDLSQLTAFALRDKITRREASPVDVLDAHLAAIDKQNPRLNAIVTLAADDARISARVAEAAVMAGAPLGPLHGLPIVIKDITPTAGIRTTYGSPLHAGNIPTEDAGVVARLRQAGAIILGKTNTPEFAAGANTVNALFGATRNPWDPELSAAGSSGGSCVAVATGMAALAQGTDFGGSLRVPAAFCGVVGLRPSVGLVPNWPSPVIGDQGQVDGPLARTAEDCALMLDAMVGLDPMWPTSVAPPWQNALSEVQACEDARGLRLAYLPDIAGLGIDPRIDAVCRKAARKLEADGAHVDEVAFDASDGIAAYKALRGAWMVGQHHARLDQLDALGANLAGNIRGGLAVTTRDLSQAEAVRRDVWARFRTLFARYDILLTPTAPVLPFPVTQNYPNEIAGRRLDDYIDWVAQAFLVTLVGFPAASVPVGLADGLPVGLQAIGPRFSEPRLLSLCKLVQRANPLPRPPLS